MIIGYLRVSTSKQHLANQQDEIRRFADSRNLHVDHWVTEIVSGKKKRADRNAHQGKVVEIRRGTLSGGTQTEVQDRKGRVSSGERPDGRDEIGSCYRSKTHCRVVQRAIRQAKAEHTPTYTAAKGRRGNEAITVYFIEKQ